MRVWNMEKSGEYLAASIKILNELIEQEMKRYSFAQRVLLESGGPHSSLVKEADGVSPKVFEFTFMLVKSYLQYAAILSQLVDHKTALQQAMTAKETLKKASTYFKSFDSSYEKLSRLQTSRTGEAWDTALSTYLDKFIFEIIHRDPTNPDTSDAQMGGIQNTERDFNEHYDDVDQSPLSDRAKESSKLSAGQSKPSSGIQTSGIIFWKHNTRNNEKYLKQELAKRYGENFKGKKLSTAWLEEFNIGNIMHLNSLTFRELDSDPMKDVLPHNLVNQVNAVLTEDRLVELVLVYACCLFSVATENRFICHKELETDKQSTEVSGPVNPVAKNYQLQQNVNFRQSEIYHFKAIEILCSFVSDCPLLNHFLGSYQKNYLPNLESIPEEDPKLVDQSVQSVNQNQLSICGGEYGTIVEPNNMSNSGKSFGGREDRTKSGHLIPQRMILEEMFEIGPSEVLAAGEGYLDPYRPSEQTPTKLLKEQVQKPLKAGGLTVYQTQIREIMLRQEKDKKKTANSTDKKGKAGLIDKPSAKGTNIQAQIGSISSSLVPNGITSLATAQNPRFSNTNSNPQSGSQTERSKSRKQQTKNLEHSHDQYTPVKGSQSIQKETGRLVSNVGQSEQRLSERESKASHANNDAQLQALLQNPLTPRYLKILANQSNDPLDNRQIGPAAKTPTDPRNFVIGNERNIHLKSLLETEHPERGSDHIAGSSLSDRRKEPNAGLLKASSLTHASSVTSNLTLAQNSLEFEDRLNSPSVAALLQGINLAKSQTSRERFSRAEKPINGLFQTKVNTGPSQTVYSTTHASNKLLSCSATSTANPMNSMFKKKFSANLVMSGNLVHQSAGPTSTVRGNPGLGVPQSTSRKSSTSSKRKSGTSNPAKSGSEQANDSNGFQTSAFHKQSGVTQASLASHGVIPMDLLNSNRPLNIKIENKDFIAKLMNINIIKINPEGKSSQYVHVSGPNEAFTASGFGVSTKISGSTERKAQSASVSKKSAGGGTSNPTRNHQGIDYTKLKSYELASSALSNKVNNALSKSQNGLLGVSSSSHNSLRPPGTTGGLLNNSRTRSEEGRKKSTVSKDSSVKGSTKRPGTDSHSSVRHSEVLQKPSGLLNQRSKQIVSSTSAKDNCSLSGFSLVTSGIQSRPSSSDRSRTNATNPVGAAAGGNSSVQNLTKVTFHKTTSKVKTELGKPGSVAKSRLEGGSGQQMSLSASRQQGGRTSSDRSPGTTKPFTTSVQVGSKFAETGTGQTPKSQQEGGSGHSQAPPKLFALLNSLGEHSYPQTRREDLNAQNYLRLGQEDLLKANLRRALKESKPLDTTDGLGLIFSSRSHATPSSHAHSSRDKKPRSYLGSEEA